MIARIEIIGIEEAENLEYDIFVTPCFACDGMVIVETQKDGTLKGTCETKDCVVNQRGKENE